MDERQQRTYDAIVARCTDLIPSIDITKHIKQGTLSRGEQHAGRHYV